jgi:hypothetical protein
MRLLRMLQGLPGEFMPRQMILLVVVLGSRQMRMRRQIVKFSRSPM